MRSQLSRCIKPGEYLLHADMWNVTRFPLRGGVNVVNCGLGESNLLNVAGGLASQGNNVYIYGVAGFIIHRLEQLKFSCKHFGALHGKIIICNAGKVGYESFGIGHKLDDDIDIMQMLGIEYFIPDNAEQFKITLDEITKKDSGIFYIQLGADE